MFIVSDKIEKEDWDLSALSIFRSYNCYFIFLIAYASLSFSHISVKARVNGKWCLNMVWKVLFLFVRQNQVQFVCVRLFWSISASEKLKLYGRHNAYRPCLTLLVYSTEKVRKKLFVRKRLCSAWSFVYSLLD